MSLVTHKSESDEEQLDSHMFQTNENTMFLYACMYMCIYVCVYVPVRLYVHVHVHIRRVHTCVGMHSSIFST